MLHGKNLQQMPFLAEKLTLIPFKTGNQARKPVTLPRFNITREALARAVGQEIKYKKMGRERKLSLAACKIMSAFIEKKNPTESERVQCHPLKNLAFFYTGNMQLKI